MFECVCVWVCVIKLQTSPPYVHVYTYVHIVDVLCVVVWKRGRKRGSKKFMEFCCCF